MNAKKFLRLTLVVGLGLMFNNVFAQQLNTTGLYQHGSNSGGADANEAIDSVTVGAAMDYFAMPDKTINTGFDETVSLTAGITTNFSWVSDNAGAGIVTKTGMQDNYVTVTWGSESASNDPDTLFVTESTGTCSDPTPTKIPVHVIAVPTATFASATNAICESDTVGGYDIDIASATEVVTGKVRYLIQVVGPNAATVYTSTINVSEGTNTLTVPGSKFSDGRGAYTISFTEISDRISRKSTVTADLSSTHVVTMNALPSTGVIFHIPNK